MKRIVVGLGIIVMLLFGCSPPRESVMPFINLGYSGERLFPVLENNSKFTFRAWVSYSTSIDRVFTISQDTDLGYAGKLLEIRGHSLNQQRKNNITFKEINITPRSGFEKFIQKVDSLNLMDLKNQDESNFFPIAEHQPFSLYVIEIKSHGKTNQFKFFTHFPIKENIEDRYQNIENLIFKELPLKFYFKQQ